MKAAPILSSNTHKCNCATPFLCYY